jgi:hypothetical protein
MNQAPALDQGAFVTGTGKLVAPGVFHGVDNSRFIPLLRASVRALRRHHASRLRLKLDAAVAVVTILLGIYLWQSPDFTRVGYRACLPLSGTRPNAGCDLWAPYPSWFSVVSLSSVMNTHLRFHRTAFIFAPFASTPRSNGACIVAHSSTLTHSFCIICPIIYGDSQARFRNCRTAGRIRAVSLGENSRNIQEKFLGSELLYDIEAMLSFCQPRYTSEWALARFHIGVAGRFGRV